ncbi:MAG: CHASE domain-containing protein [Bacteroidetes bacterium]|nr:CHASE domain-containing protein [Bacteroidota bacterium]
MKSPTQATPSGNAWKALIILIICIILTIAATLHTKNNIEARAKSEFALVCDEIEVKITTRLHAHAQLLRAGSAFFAASDTVTRTGWREFIKQAKIDENLPGIQGVGFSMIIPKNQLQRHIQTIRNEGFPNYTVKPAGEREIYTSIIYLEPFTDRNLRAFGYDMFSEPVRRKAVEISRDNDIAMLSGKALFVQETNQDVQPGALMYVPVYRNGMAVNTVEQRRSAIKGWVYSPYRMNDLMQGILGRWDKIQDERIHLQVYDDSISASSLLFDSQSNDTLNHDDSPSRQLSVPVEFNGKKWILYFSQPKEQLFYFDSKVIIVFIGGIIISFLLSGLILSLVNTKAKAIQIAKKLTAELKDSETKFKTVADFTYDWEYWEGNDRRLIYISPSCERISGYKPDEFLSDSKLLGKIVHPDDLKLWDNHFEKAHSLEHLSDIDEIEYRIIKKDGSLTFIGHLCRPVFDEKESYLGRRINSRDITARKLAENALAVSETRYRRLFESAKDGILILDAETGMIMDVNPFLIEMLGYSKEQFIEKAIWEIGFLHDVVANQDKFIELQQNEYVRYENLPLETFYGKRINVEFISNLYLVDNRKVIQCNIRDITERRLAEEALKNSESRSNALIEAIPDLMFTLNDEGIYLDFIGDKDSLAFQSQSIIGKRNRDIMPSEFADLVDEKIKLTFQTRQMQVFEYQLPLPAQGICDFEARMVPSSSDEVVVIVRNITDRKKTEAEIKLKNEELQKLNATKDKFFSIIAHDLKSPFNSIVGFSDLLVEQVKEKDYEGIGKYAGIILKSSWRALDLLTNLMEWTRSQTGRMEYNPEYFEMVAFLNELILSFDAIAGQKSIVIKKALPSNAAAFADKAMISTVMRNLISNAIKFTPIGGKITISAEEKESELLVTVSDSGVGISNNRIEKLFRIDESYSTAGTNNERGTGLGLILCKDFIEKHGGKIRVESEEGKGSTFRLTLPVKF